jgi:hypothetical protein
MKRMMSLLLTFMGVLSIGSVLAQECVSYYPVKQGFMSETTSYDAKSKVTGMTRTTVLSNETTPTGYKVTIKSETFDAKNVSNGSGEYGYSCNGGKFVLSMKNFFNPSTAEAYKDMEVVMDATDIDMPANPTPGTELQEGRLTMTASTNGFTVMNMKIRMYNRKVAAVETITTTAGTFECIKLTYDMDTDAMFKMTTKGVEWYSKEVGAVKTETYDASGKLVGSSQLTKITR